MNSYFKMNWLIYFYTPDRGCTSKQGWQPRGNYIDSGNNQADDVYMSLKLPVKGFGSSEGLANPRTGQYGVVEFVFEMICEGECTFKFKEVKILRESTVLNTLLLSAATIHRCNNSSQYFSSWSIQILNVATHCLGKAEIWVARLNLGRRSHNRDVWIKYPSPKWRWVGEKTDIT